MYIYMYIIYTYVYIICIGVLLPPPRALGRTRRGEDQPAGVPGPSSRTNKAPDPPAQRRLAASIDFVFFFGGGPV